MTCWKTDDTENRPVKSGLFSLSKKSSESWAFLRKYGIIEAKYIEDRVYKVKDLVEKPELDKAPSNIAILGRYIITPEIFEILETLPPGKNGEVQLTDALRMLSKKEAMYAYDFDGVRYDVGDKLGFLKATVDFALKRPNLQNDFIQYLREVCDKFDKKTTENEQ